MFHYVDICNIEMLRKYTEMKTKQNKKNMTKQKGNYQIYNVNSKYELRLRLMDREQSPFKGLRLG